jgi:heavy metal efflux system protein
VEANLFRGMVLVLIVLMFFLVSFRAAIIVALTIPLSLLFAFIVLHAHDGAANLLSIGAIDFGIIIDGTVVMVENIYRELALRQGENYKLHEVILLAAKDVDRPIFYSVAVILAGYLPIYALSGPSGKLFHPMAETMSFALVGSLILTLTLVPVLTSYWFKKGNTRASESRLRLDEARIRNPAGLGAGAPQTYSVDRHVDFRCDLAAGSFHRRRIHAAP